MNLDTNLEQFGLNREEVAERRRQGLVNQPLAPQNRSLARIILDNLFSVFNLIIASVCIFVLIFYFRTADTRLLLDIIGMVSVALLNTLIAIFQEFRAKRALERVRLLFKPTVMVIRDGGAQEIGVHEIVAGDALLIGRGDQAVVDGSLLFAAGLEMNESLLTGESEPITKEVGEEILSGSFCLQGKGIYRAERLGQDCYAQKIIRLAHQHKQELTPLQKKINLIVKLLFGIALVLAFAHALSFFLSPSQEHFSEADFARQLATILISLIPQGLVLFSSVTFALGVWRISRLGAIIQRLNAIESFSHLNILLADKTGTLTENKLKLHSLTFLDSELSQERVAGLLGSFAASSLDQNATLMALLVLPPLAGTEKLAELPFNSALKYSLLSLQFGSDIYYLALGAYDVLLEYAPPSEKQKAERYYQEKGLGLCRTLIFGRLLLNREEKTASPFNLSPGCFQPLCLVSISDSLRPDARQALDELAFNGIQLKVLSGDSGQTVAAILAELGRPVSPHQIISGIELDRLDPADLAQTVKHKTVFCRLKPEHKQKIVEALRSQGSYLAMLGDGVNDLPAIKAANLGLAMEEGSSATREVSDIILLKNKFSLLPKIFAEGNRILNTVVAVAKLFLTKNILVVILFLLSLFSLAAFPLTPRRVSFINLFAIGLPALFYAVSNKNSLRLKNFLGEIFSHVFLAAGFIVFSGLVIVQEMRMFISLNSLEAETILVINTLLMCSLNFFMISYNAEPKRMRYPILSLCLSFSVIFLSLFQGEFLPIKLIQIFYEIYPIKLDIFWVFLPSFIGLALLFGGLQWLRWKLCQHWLSKKSLPL